MLDTLRGGLSYIVRLSGIYPHFSGIVRLPVLLTENVLTNEQELMLTRL